jgi:hypothetical protein
MALKQRISIAMPLLGLLVATLVILPPKPMPDSSRWFSSEIYDWSFAEGRVHRNAVESALRQLRNRVDGTAAADSLVRLAGSAGVLRSQDGLIAVLYERSLRRDSAQRWLEWLANELAIVPAAGSGVGGAAVPIIVALHSDTTRWTSINPGWSPWSERRQIQGAGENQRCVVELRLHGKGTRPGQGDGRLVRPTNSGVRATDALDWCALYARFGAPGSLMARWSGMAGRYSQYGYFYSSGSVRNRIESARGRGVPQTLPGALFRLASCARGDAPACTRALGLDRALSPEGRGGWWYGGGLSLFNEPTRIGFLTSLLATEPPERFAALWRSELPVSQALASAYGADAGTLVMRWAQRRFKLSALESNPYESPFGPAVAQYVAQYGESRASALDAITSLGWAALLLGVGALIATRRQSGS